MWVNFSYWFWRTTLQILLFKTCRVHILHRERSRKTGAWILASNHISHFDPPLLSFACHRVVNWMAMEELFQPPWFGWLLQSVRAFPVRRGKPDRQALRVATERLAEKRVVGIFPEGGIRDGTASVLLGGPMRPGIGLVAGLAKVPILPAVILGTDRLYNKRRWLSWGRTNLWIAFGEELTPPGPTAADRLQFENDLSTAWQNLRQEVVEHFGLREEDLPRPPAVRQREP
jgi:1-acyl-sn-glycerol-3-phosphate acyltransferase